MLKVAKKKTFREINKKNSLLIKNKNHINKVSKEFFIVLNNTTRAVASLSLFCEIVIAAIFPKPKLSTGATKLKKCKKI